mgnify:CR=1 FL=1
MRNSFNFRDKSFAVYGLGLSGRSTINFLKKNRAKIVFSWDDYINKSNFKFKNKFKTNLNLVDFIVVSPGINIKKSKFKKLLLKKQKKNNNRLRFIFFKK